MRSRPRLHTATGGLLGLFRTCDGRVPDDPTARCALRLDLRLAVVELAALDLDLDVDVDVDAGQPAAASAAAPAPMVADVPADVATDAATDAAEAAEAAEAEAEAVAAAAAGDVGSWRAVCRAVGRSLQVNAAHGLVEVTAPTLGQARRQHAGSKP